MFNLYRSIKLYPAENLPRPGLSDATLQNINTPAWKVLMKPTPYSGSSMFN